MNQDGHRLDKSPPPEGLRARAEEVVGTLSGDIDAMSAEEVERLVHELRIHQVELELQNQQLLATQMDLAEARDRYSDLYDFAPIGYFSLRSDGVIAEANLTAAELLERKRVALVGRKFTEFVDSHSQDTWFLKSRVASQSRLRYTFELALSRPDGRSCPVQVVVGPEVHTPADGEDGELGLRVTLSDITDLKAAQEVLAASEHRYRRLTEAMTGHIFAVEIADGREIATTHGPRCEAFTGYKPGEFARNDRLWMSRIPADDREQVKQKIQDTLAGRETAPLEHRFDRKDGTQQWVVLVTVPEFDDQGRLVSYDALLRDITEQKQAELEPR